MHPMPTKTLPRVIAAALLLAADPLAWADQPARPATGYDPARAVCRVTDRRIDEASGIVASRRYPGLYYVHNDSAGRPEIYVLNRTGTIVATLRLRGARNVDWEDIAMAPGTGSKRWDVCVADIGDNQRRRPEVVIYRFAEPDLAARGSQVIAVTPRVVRCRYEDGPRDAEALVVDPLDGAGYVLTKRWDGRCGAYRLADWSAPQPVTLRKVGWLRFPPATLPIARMVTGADITPDGRRLVVRTYIGGWEWTLPTRTKADGFLRLIATRPRALTLAAEPQGEAICYAADGSALLTISERSPTVLYEARRMRQTTTRPAGRAEAVPAPDAAWELHLLGCDTPARLARLRHAPKWRRVRLGIVGQDGVSQRYLEDLLDDRDTITYHDCADPNRNTHDTQMARITLNLTQPLGVRVDLHVWQAGPSFDDYADKFRAAAQACDVVALYQSFWGPGAGRITRAIRQSPGALFISPYVEHGGHPTGQTPQGSAHRPWSCGTIGHFVTVAPLPRRGTPGVIVTPSDRGPEDSEAVNWIAPSYHANGPGGTCPAAAVGCACACYLWAVLPAQPAPGEIVDRLRRCARLDRRLLASLPEFNTQTADRLAAQIQRLRHPPSGKQRKLDANGILNLHAAYRDLVRPEHAGRDRRPASGRE